jgi:tetratricopeptide (TPR) repeat protein
MNETAPSRNAQCHCGSGKKYKHCCARHAAAAKPSIAKPVAVTPATMANRLIALAKSQRYPDMESLAREMVRVLPRSGFAWKSLGVALQMQGKEALQALQCAVQLLPEDADCHGNLGTALRRLGRLQEAAECMHRALRLKPGLPELWNNLGNVQKDLGQFDDAITSLRRAINLRPDFAQALNNLGNALLGLGQLDQAAASYRQAIAIQADYVEAHVNLGIVQRSQGLLQEAEEHCRRALELDANSAAALRLMAELRSDQGEFAAAENLYNQAMLIEPDSAEAWAGMAGLRRMTVEDTAWLARAQLLVARSPSSEELYLRYAMGKFFDDVGDYEQAFANYRRANELAIRARPAHDRRLLALGIDHVIQHQSREWLQHAAAGASSAERPVFIVGMPRSGTTLAEQILASHSGVFGAGELPFWNSAVKAGAGARVIGEDETPGLRQAAEAYLAQLATLSAGAQRVVDKMPANFLHLGVIHAALPKAKIIHLRRNPLDTCLSIYFQNFGAMHPYANDLDDLADYYGQYLRIMEHWRLALPVGVVLDVDYEALVEETETWSRRMLDFIGLPWEANCLEFYNCRRRVSTFSKWQARQKISRSSIGRWRHYERFIGSLLPLVGDHSADRRRVG